MVKPSFISFEKRTPRGVDVASSQEGEITLFANFQEGDEYRAPNGSVMKILSVTTSGRFLIYLKDSLEGVVENDPEKKYTKDQLRKLIEEQGFVLSAKASVPAEFSISEPRNDASSQVVVDMNEAREARGMEPVVPDAEQQGVLKEQDSRYEDEIADTLEDINTKTKEIFGILKEMVESPDVVEIKGQIKTNSESVGAVLEQDSLAKAEQEGKLFTREYVDAKRGRLENLQTLLAEIQTLSDEVRDAVTETSIPTEVIMATAGEGGAVTTGSGEGVSSEKKKQPARKGKGGGSGDGGDGTGDDKAVTPPKKSELKPEPKPKKSLRDIVPEPSVVPKGASIAEGKRVGHRDKPKDPEDFGGVMERLQAGVVAIIRSIKTPEGYATFRDRMLKRKSLEEGRPPVRHFFHLDTIRREAGIPQQQRFSSEEEEQIRELEKNLEQAARNKFQELVVADFHGQYDREQAKIDSAKNEGDLSQQPNVDFVWEEVLSALTEWEQKRVSGEYQECLDRLNENFRQKRNYLRGAPVEKSGAKKISREEAKEPSDEEQFASLVRALQDGKTASFRKGAHGKELVIESITDAEIIYNDGGKLPKTVTPRYVKGFLKFLREEFSWSLKDGRRDGAKDGFGEASPKVEKSTGRAYEVLKESISNAEKKQYGSIVAEGLGPFVEYVKENTAVTLRDLINSETYGGVAKVAEALSPAVLDRLPAVWSPAEKRLFALQFTKQEINESL